MHKYHMQEPECVSYVCARVFLLRLDNDNAAQQPNLHQTTCGNESGTLTYLSFQRKFVPNQINHLAESLPYPAFSC
jgi:hypothetical protein